ncbi:MAG TPA: tripartite tricarboxylate transporter permease [Candidatus Pacearchaeota archaeon]|nr:tripartite tricarboxylate transporter permease [Candidatus Pacearchaeota archaeon]
MLIQIIVALLLGILVGVFTGLFPGIHINLVGAFLVTLSSTFLAGISPIYLIVFIASLAIAHTFIDFIPSIFLGCPDSDTELSVLPGHELLKQGEGHSAIMRTAYGGLISIFILVLLTLPLVHLISWIYPIIRKLIPFILIFVCFLMIFSEKKKFSAAVVLILTGFFGVCVLNLNLKEPLLPLLSGLFGSSMMLMSINQNTKIPKQKTLSEKLNLKKVYKPILAALIASPLCGFLPGLGGGQAAVIGNQISRSDKKDFLILLGAVNILVMGISFISLYSISKTRTGASAAIQSLIGTLNLNLLILIIIICLFSGVLSFFLTKFLSLKFLKIIEKVNYKKLSIGILIFLSIIICMISGILGFFVFIVSTATGIYCISLNVKRTQMMGCLLIPTIILYLF